MQDTAPTIYIVDDDASVREGLDSLLRSVGYQVRAFASAEEFLLSRRPNAPACVVLDVRMPGPSGLDLQQELAKIKDPTPIVFLTGHGDVPMSVRAIRAGAVEFLLKPFREQDLLDAIRMAIEKHRALLLDEAVQSDLRERLSTLTMREREVLERVVRGRINKDIATELGLSEITVKVHRAQAMRKMQADSLADLIRMCDRLGM